MKKFTAIVAAVVFFVGLGLAAVAADAPAGPVKVTNFGKKDVVTFDHAKHTSAECATCHHKAESGDFKCGTCHGDDGAMKDAAHKKDVGKCWTCHNKKSPSVVKELKCKDCHAG